MCVVELLDRGELCECVKLEAVEAASRSPAIEEVTDAQDYLCAFIIFLLKTLIAHHFIPTERVSSLQ